MPSPTETVPAAARMPDVLEHSPAFDAFCFGGEEFPRVEFGDVRKAQEFFGPYELRTAFFDVNGNRVERAEREGRYGAIVEIHHQRRKSRRFMTLCRVTGITQAFAAAGIDADILAERQHELAAPEEDRFQPKISEDAQRGVWAAGLLELTELRRRGAAMPAETLSQLDKRWWIEFKRRFYGLEKAQAKRFEPPHKTAERSSPILRRGNLHEAGFKADAQRKIDAAAEAWVRETGVGFAVSIARHGVLAVNKGHGVVPRGPEKGAVYTPETISPLASLTKFLGAIVLLQFVDQGLIGFDEPAEKYLPALKNIENTSPPTIRDLYTHTAGLTGHWGDSLNDMEEVVADIYPTLRSGAAHQYHGAGHALGGKIMESLAGETMSRLYQRCLFEPLGCEHTKVEQTSYGSWSTSAELARVGQMLLNGGTYGERHFFSPETLRGMLPIPGRDRFEPQRNIRWGVGIKQQDNDGLSDQAFGHSGASGSFLVIDPARDLMMAMTRFEEGSPYESFLKHKRDFIMCVTQSLI